MRLKQYFFKFYSILKTFTKFSIHIVFSFIAKFFPSFLFDKGFLRIINFHNPSAKSLDSILSVLNLVAPFTNYDRIVTCLRTRSKLPSGYAFTFDDGYKENIKLIPILKKYNCQACFFVSALSLIEKRHLWFIANKNNLKRYKKSLKKYDYDKFLNSIFTDSTYNDENNRTGISSAELKELFNSGQKIGVHTITHPFLTKLRKDQIIDEVEGSYLILKKHLNFKELPFDFAFPDGDHNNFVIDALKDIGVRSAATIQHLDINQDTNPYKIPRYGAADNDFPGYVLFKQTKFYKMLIKLIPF